LGYKRRHINSQCNTRPGNWYHAEPGYAKEEHPANFDYISLLDIPRKERFSILTQYLHHVRQTFSNHLLLVLDVTTDCIRDFNRSDDSLELIDLMNEAILRMVFRKLPKTATACRSFTVGT
jgi:hypothetical protein